MERSDLRFKKLFLIKGEKVSWHKSFYGYFVFICSLRLNIFLPFQLSYDTCHVAPVTCRVSPVTFHLSHVTCHMSHFFPVQNGETSWWRVYYQRGLPHLVSLYHDFFA